MRIFMACPAPPPSRTGNRVTATRWAALLEQLGHAVTIAQEYEGEPFDVMIALHARKSHSAVKGFHRRNPAKPLVVALTGTDLYRDIHASRSARESLELADLLVVLQPLGRDELPGHLRWKVRVIVQSAVPTIPRPPRRERSFDVCVLGHLRSEKDPFRTALALRYVSADSRIRVTHAGQAMSAPLAKRARLLGRRDSRYRWIGELSRRRARLVLARSRLLVVSSRMEGGANVVSEALADQVPVLASRIPGNVGLLGPDYPGYFPVGDARALAELMSRVEMDPTFYGLLARRFADGPREVAPARERTAWQELLRELHVGT
jgi:putative glycosyltransferase (TIGR04348 family)